MHTKTLTELKAGLANRDFSSREKTEHFLARIQHYDSDLPSFVTVPDTQALAPADADRLAAADARARRDGARRAGPRRAAAVTWRRSWVWVDGANDGRQRRTSRGCALPGSYAREASAHPL